MALRAGAEAAVRPSHCFKVLRACRVVGKQLLKLRQRRGETRDALDFDEPDKHGSGSAEKHNHIFIYIFNINNILKIIVKLISRYRCYRAGLCLLSEPEVRANSARAITGVSNERASRAPPPPIVAPILAHSRVGNQLSANPPSKPPATIQATGWRRNEVLIGAVSRTSTACATSSSVCAVRTRCALRTVRSSLQSLDEARQGGAAARQTQAAPPIAQKHQGGQQRNDIQRQHAANRETPILQPTV